MKLTAIFLGKSDDTRIHLVRAMASSAVGFSVDFGILLLLVEAAGMHYIAAATIGFVVGTTITYLLSIFWIFPRRNMKRKSAEYMLFIAVGVVGVLLNDGLLWMFTELLSIYYLISRILSGSLVFFWNFFARKRLLFR
jgi:putative flippase GtrA